MGNLPYALEPMSEDRSRLLAILDLLDKSAEPVVRADLAIELVAVGSRYEDVKERVVYPAMTERLAEVGPEVGLFDQERVRVDQDGLRDALAEIRRRTQHVKPAYVHIDDPDGFEAALDDLAARLRAHISHEDEVLFPILVALSPAESEELRAEVEHAAAHASSHPTPPKSAIGRAAMAVAEKIDHLVQHDESTPWHPGVDKLEETLDESPNTAER